LPEPAGESRAVAPFLRQVRRRWLVRQGLRFLLVACAANAGVLWATKFAQRFLGRELPQLTTAPFVFLALLAGALVRARPEMMAREADRALRLKDRLASFLDLGSRADVDDRYRKAQAAETASTLATVDPRSAVAVPRWLWVAPPLFLWVIYASYFSFFLPQPLQFVRRLRIAVSGLTGRSATGESPAGTSGGIPEANPSRGSAKPSPPPSPRPDGETAPPQPPPPGKAHSDPPPGGADTTGTAQAGLDKTHGGVSGGAGPTSLPQPARLFSVPVSSTLTPVGEAGEAQSARKPPGEAVPQGRVAFNLVPGRGSGSGLKGPGSGQGTGKGEGLQVVVDFAALPSDVREQVRRYFAGLSQLFTGGPLGTR